MTEQFTPLQNGTILQNRYKIVGLLGKGGMGAVYQASHLVLKTEVAVKQTILVDNIDFIRAFKREASLLANLKHENIPKVTDFFNENNEHFIIMELVDGEDLGDRLERFQKNGIRNLPFAEIFDITNKLLEVLQYLHSQNIIHKDIKPSNLKITSRGKLKLLDFGLAKGSIGFMTTHLSSFLKGATPDYAPPEQLSYKRTDQRSDLFSVGATVYHLLSGKVPPHPLNERAIYIANDEPDPLRLVCDFNTEVPKEFAKILHKAMAFKPDNRFESAQEMIEAIKLAQKNLEKSNRKKEAVTKTQPLIHVKPDSKVYDERKGFFWTIGVAIFALILLILINDPEKDILKANLAVTFNNSINTTTNTFDNSKAPSSKVSATDYSERGKICFIKGDLPCARANYDKAIELQPNYVFYQQRALILEELKDYNSAIEDYSKLILIIHDAPDNYLKRSLLYNKVGNKEKAFDDIRIYFDLMRSRN